LTKIENNPNAKKDLAEVRKQIKKEEKNKIKEVQVESSSTKEEAGIQEVEEVEPQQPKTALKTRNIDQEAVDKAAERAAQDAVSMTIGSIPKTSAGFETDLRQLKNNSAHVYKYLNNIPL